MQAFRYSVRVMTGSCLSAVVALNCAIAQPAPAFEPKVGQRGKDVVWVPTNQQLVDKMLDMAKVTADDYVIDRLTGDAKKVLQLPEPKEVVLINDAPWEGNISGYYVVFQDGDGYKMYYRGGASFPTGKEYHDGHSNIG